MNTKPSTCPLCKAIACNYLFHQDRQRDYYRCQNCNLVYIPPSQFLSSKAELEEYSKHQNSPADSRYRTFLKRLFEPLNEKLKSSSHGLDFGCGPGPTLSVMFEEAGHRMSLYDPLFAQNKAVFSKQYDFITASEVVEHLHHPERDFELIWSILKPGGWLGVMTKLALDETSFAQWHYKNDRTHVCFFSAQTMAWLARRWGAMYELIGKDVILFQKPSK